MSGPTSKWKRQIARLIRRAGSSPAGQKIPPQLKRRGVDLAKKLLGDATLQARIPQRSGIVVRPLGLLVALDTAESASFRSERIDEVPGRFVDWPELTHLDALVTPRPSTWEREDDRRRTLEVLRPGLVDPRVTAPPIPDGLTPLGFDLDRHEVFATFGPPGAENSPAAIAAVPPGVELISVDPDDLPDPLERPDRWSRAVQPLLGILDDPGHWSDPQQRAATLMRCAAVGVPVVTIGAEGHDRGLGDWLAPELLDQFRGTSPIDLVDPIRRDRIASRQWAEAHDHHGARATWDRALLAAGRPGVPAHSVSVVLPTNRPEMIANWAPQIAAQIGVDWECVVALHGPDFGSADHACIREHLGDRVRILTAPTEHRLGDLLNAASRAAGGDLIVKWDDDDLYDREHLADLVRTYDYSGATLVGKACEYVHLAGPDVTVRRDQGRRETFSATIAGGTLTIDRGDLFALGGWRRAPRRVDSLLIESVLASGGLTYRAIGFGYIMRRAGGSGHRHTWDVDDVHFLDPRFEQRRGLALDFAGVRAPTEALRTWVTRGTAG